MKRHGFFASLMSAQSSLKSAGVLILGFAVAAPALGDTPVPVADPAGSGSGRIKVELNRADQLEGTCRLTFTAQNGLDKDLSGMVLETVLFDTNGGVITLSLFDFQALPKGKPRVRQFDLGATQCDALGQVLINGVAQCDGADPAVCAAGLSLHSRTKQEVLG